MMLIPCVFLSHINIILNMGLVNLGNLQKRDMAVARKKSPSSIWTSRGTTGTKAPWVGQGYGHGAHKHPVPMPHGPHGPMAPWPHGWWVGQLMQNLCVVQLLRFWTPRSLCGSGTGTMNRFSERHSPSQVCKTKIDKAHLPNVFGKLASTGRAEFCKSWCNGLDVSPKS